MEDSEVLDAESKAAPLQPPEKLVNTASSFATMKNETPNKNIYSSPVVGEKNYTDDISTNINRSDYNYNKAIDKSTEPVVQTTSTTKGNVTEPAYWEAHYGMDDTYKATDNEDYSWNKLAQDRAQYTYEQEATQVLSDYAKSMQEIKEAGSQAMDQYFGAAYSANQTADKMGWQGGQVTSNDAKAAFLKASTAANMYSKFELQDYGVDSQLQVARLYADANMEALALDMYQDAIDTAVREAELTGYYIAPEASELMKQQKVASDILAKPNATDAEIQRANQVIGAANDYFDKLGFQKDEYGHYIGVEVLANLELQETIRANQENERLTGQANEIAAAGVQATYDAAGQAYTLGNLQLQYTKNLTEATNRNTALKEYGSATIGNDTVGSYTIINGNATKVSNVTKALDGNTYGVVNGKTYQVSADNKTNTIKLGKQTASVDTINKNHMINTGKNIVYSLTGIKLPS